MIGTTMIPPAVPARRRPTTWLALAMLSLSLGMVTFMFASAVLPGHEQLSIGIRSVADMVTLIPTLGAFIGLPAVGATLAVLRPANPIGWVLLVGGAGLVVGDFAGAYVEHSVVLGSDLPGHRVVDWLSPAFTALAFPLLTQWLPLLFPDGRLPGPRWRVVGVIAAVNTAVTVAATFVAAYGGDYGRRFSNPIWGGELAEIAAGVSATVSGGLIVAAIAAVVVRFRRSRGADRQQMKWFVAAIALVGASMAPLAVLQNAWAWALMMLALALLPIAIGIAVLRYRLYEIDRIISRTIGWAIVTGSLVAVFAGVVVGLQAVLSPVTEENTLAVAASTLVAAAISQPLYRRVQAIVDRRFNRTRADAEQAVAQLGARLRDETDDTRVRAEIQATVRRALAPSSTALWVRREAER